MKTKRVQIDKKEVMRIDKGLIMGLVDDGKKVKVNVVGDLLFEEVLDLTNTALYDLLNHFREGVILAEPKTDITELTKDIYKRAVLGFSLMIDKFYPEGKNDRFGKLTEEAIIKAQNDILKERKNKKGEKLN